MSKVDKLYNYSIDMNEEEFKLEEKRIEKLFGKLNDEQINYLTEMRYKFFKLGYNSALTNEI